MVKVIANSKRVHAKGDLPVPPSLRLLTVLYLFCPHKGKAQVREARYNGVSVYKVASVMSDYLRPFGL